MSHFWVKIKLYYWRSTSCSLNQKRGSSFWPNTDIFRALQNVTRVLLLRRHQDPKLQGVVPNLTQCSVFWVTAAMLLKRKQVIFAESAAKPRASGYIFAGYQTPKLKHSWQRLRWPLVAVFPTSQTHHMIWLMRLQLLHFPSVSARSFRKWQQGEMMFLRGAAGER